MSTSENHRVELSAVQVLAGGDGFVVECEDHRQQPVRLQFPGWAMYQLMRALPRVEAALHHGQVTGQVTRPEKAPAGILAHAVADWWVDCSGRGAVVAFCLRTDRNVESGFAFDVDSAVAFHRQLGNAIARAATADVQGRDS